MGYTRRPLNPLTPFVNQVVVESNAINENFDILAQAFVGNNPETFKVKEALNSDNSQNAVNSQNADTVDGFHASLTPAPNIIVPLNANGILDLSATYVRSNVYTFRRVDLTNATSDYELQVGEEAIIWGRNRQIVPLHIATHNGTIYEMIMQDSGQPTYLYPNNTAYPNQFASYRLYAFVENGNWFHGVGGSTSLNQPAFLMFSGMKRILIINQTEYKRLFVHYADVREYHHGISASFWENTTTPWISLGMLYLNWANSNFILVRRLA